MIDARLSERRGFFFSPGIRSNIFTDPITYSRRNALWGGGGLVSNGGGGGGGADPHNGCQVFICYNSNIVLDKQLLTYHTSLKYFKTLHRYTVSILIHLQKQYDILTFDYNSTVTTELYLT